LPSFSIEVVPETVWDPEHQHAHVIGGEFKGTDLVLKGACTTCNIDSAVFGFTKPNDGAKVYKFGLNLNDYLTSLYWGKGLSTQAISDKEGIPRSTIENWMEEAGTPRRDLQEARSLRSMKEILKMSGNPRIIALGTGANTVLPKDDCPQCLDYKKGGRSKRNLTATLFIQGSDQLLINAPKGIIGMLGIYNAKPNFIILEHHHEDVIGGLHELRGLNPIVGASKDTWDYIRRHYKAISGQEGTFEEIYNFRRVILKETPIAIGKNQNLIVTPIVIQHSKPGDPPTYGFKIKMGEVIIWHSSDVLKIPNHKKILDDVDIYIGDGSSLTRGIKRETDGEFGHASIEEQLDWIKNLNLKQIYFTQIGHIGKTQDELNDWLQEGSPNAQALFDGAEINTASSTPSLIIPKRLAGKFLDGEIDTFVKTKPYQDYSKQVIYLVGGDEILALIVEGLPTGPIDAMEAKKQNHGMTDTEWKKIIGSASKVWVYKPKIVKRYEVPKKVVINPGFAESYLHNTRLAQ